MERQEYDRYPKEGKAFMIIRLYDKMGTAYIQDWQIAKAREIIEANKGNIIDLFRIRGSLMFAQMIRTYQEEGEVQFIDTFDIMLNNLLMENEQELRNTNKLNDYERVKIECNGNAKVFISDIAKNIILKPNYYDDKVIELPMNSYAVDIEIAAFLLMRFNKELTIDLKGNEKKVFEIIRSFSNITEWGKQGYEEYAVPHYDSYYVIELENEGEVRLLDGTVKKLNTGFIRATTVIPLCFIEQYDEKPREEVVETYEKLLKHIVYRQDDSTESEKRTNKRMTIRHFIRL